ncbi:hypothetical protein ACVNY3_005332 [Escherichia coli]
MKNIKTHTGLLIHKEQARRVRLHEIRPPGATRTGNATAKRPVVAAAALTVSAG